MTGLRRLALNPLCWLPLLGLAAFLLISAAPSARGDKVPGFAPSNARYFSTDMTPVTVHFVRNRDAFTPDTARRRPVVATARIPRAYIYFASPYRQPDYPVVPGEIWTTQLDLMLVYPDGQPYSVTWNRLREEGGLPNDAATRHLRPLHSFVHLNTSTLEYATNMTPHEAGARQVESSLDGVSEFRHSDSGPMFFRIPANESIRIIKCQVDIERSHPTFFCEYQIRLSADMIASAYFLDFRLHGGRDFANERIANIREVLCGFVTCDPRWAATQTDIRGSR